ncbi:MAG: tRNA epoxyqueuosine(34) reductase QueG [Candidatus Fischerbacteria bacterium RBG_13_37_8]|uniref:tRNA epoxyqueuosine(34) reductase QueG n=1 Tax=Candidatus Fischerbacteria bacterium RBG_13_37_8 TaxID=1817863 RepID=A0A1F5VS52_9BACT|nr:MAG: tRNA epoxyqueuosine(34) reductase QueG [Candidatus Fischerbacteria bacterium RBG_13_37_8]
MANFSRAGLTPIIKQEAKTLGFDRIGIVEKKSLQHSGYIKQWIKQGYHADMKYMAENLEKRIDINKVFGSCESIIVVAENYYKPAKRDKYMHIARYAAAKDYHGRIKAKLVSLAKTIQSMEPSLQYKAYVDTGPVMEKLWAVEAGIGWMGKHSIIINKGIGSWFCIGILLVNQTLEPDHPVKDKCGDCMRCIETCPTGAIIQPYVVDARRCISYLTIENKQEIPTDYLDKLSGYFFGCDICQEACPWNKGRFKGTSKNIINIFARHKGTEAQRHKGIEIPGEFFLDCEKEEDNYFVREEEILPVSYSKEEMEKLLLIKEQEFKRIYSGYAIRRLVFKNFRRNIQAYMK